MYCIGAYLEIVI